MAVFESIRKRSGLVIVIIGFALLAFILTDLLSSGNVLFNANADAVGIVDGEKIKFNEFNTEIEEARASNPQYAQMSALQLSEMIWNQHITRILLGSIQEEAGFVVTSEELFEAIKSNPNIQNMEGFRDPATGAFNEVLFTSAIQNLRDNKESTEEARAQWKNWVGFERDVRNQTLAQKFNVAVMRGLRMPEALVKYEYLRNARTADADVAYVPYSSLEDSQVELKDADFEAYYEETKENYRTDKDLRSILYVNFAVQPSANDLAEAKKEMAVLAVEFKTNSNDSAFIAANSDYPYQDEYYKEAELSMGLDTLVKGRPVGYMAGPIAQQGTFQLIKVLDRRMIPDSARARHILIAFAGAERSQSQRSYDAAKKLADSILTIVTKNGGAFEAFNAQYNDDKMAQSKGGDLDWFPQNAMAKPFNDYCFRNNTGKMGMVATNFGFHIVQITGQKGGASSVKLGFVARAINVSEATEQGANTAANQFATKAKNLSSGWEELAQREKVALRPAQDFASTEEVIVGLGQAREVVRWAFQEDREMGDVDVLNLVGRAYVVTILTGQIEKGYKPLEAVKDQIRPVVMQRAKAEILMKKWNTASKGGQWQKAATAMGGSFGPVTVNMASPFLMISGQEMELVGRMVGSVKGTKSEAVRGDNGVYAFQVRSVTDAPDKGLYTMDVANANNMMRSRAQGQLFQAIVKKATIEDYRGRLF